MKIILARRNHVRLFFIFLSTERRRIRVRVVPRKKLRIFMGCCSYKFCRFLFFLFAVCFTKQLDGTLCRTATLKRLYGTRKKKIFRATKYPIVYGCSVRVVFVRLHDDKKIIIIAAI